MIFRKRFNIFHIESAVVDVPQQNRLAVHAGQDNERKDVDTWLFADPIIDRFCRLCQEYERDKGITEEKNPYRSTIEQTIRENFRFDSYSYVLVSWFNSASSFWLSDRRV